MLYLERWYKPCHLQVIFNGPLLKWWWNIPLTEQTDSIETDTLKCWWNLSQYRQTTDRHWYIEATFHKTYDCNTPLHNACLINRTMSSMPKLGIAFLHAFGMHTTHRKCCILLLCPLHLFTNLFLYRSGFRTTCIYGFSHSCHFSIFSQSAIHQISFVLLL